RPELGAAPLPSADSLPSRSITAISARVPADRANSRIPQRRLPTFKLPRPHCIVTDASQACLCLLWGSALAADTWREQSLHSRYSPHLPGLPDRASLGTVAGATFPS